jgi:hypothetical protein
MREKGSATVLQERNVNTTCSEEFALWIHTGDKAISTKRCAWGHSAGTKSSFLGRLLTLHLIKGEGVELVCHSTKRFLAADSAPYKALLQSSESPSLRLALLDVYTTSKWRKKERERERERERG